MRTIRSFKSSSPVCRFLYLQLCSRSISTSRISEDFEQQPVIDLIDSNVTSKRSNVQKTKLQRSLETPKKRLLTSAERGSMDAQSEDVMDLLNESLHSSKMHGLFRNTGDASKFVEITSVNQNQDRSHTTAFWSSSILEKFAARIFADKGEDEAIKFASKAVQYITSRLQRKEPLFRALLTKKMSFKRVPRIFFRPTHEFLKVGADEQHSDRRQSILRESGASERSL